MSCSDFRLVAHGVPRLSQGVMRWAEEKLDEFVSLLSPSQARTSSYCRRLAAGVDGIERCAVYSTGALGTCGAPKNSKLQARASQVLIPKLCAGLSRVAPYALRLINSPS